MSLVDSIVNQQSVSRVILHRDLASGKVKSVVRWVWEVRLRYVVSAEVLSLKADVADEEIELDVSTPLFVVELTYTKKLFVSERFRIISFERI